MRATWPAQVAWGAGVEFALNSAARLSPYVNQNQFLEIFEDLRPPGCLKPRRLGIPCCFPPLLRVLIAKANACALAP